MHNEGVKESNSMPESVVLEKEKPLNTKGTTKSLGNKEKNDKFYTKETVVESILELINIEEYDLIIEPSAGSGSFSSKLKQIHKNVLAYDLVPESDDVIEQDWLSMDKSEFERLKVLVVGNPPFGTNGNLALKFIKESSFADTIAFILPKSFKKETFKNRIPVDFHCTLEQDMPTNAFMLNGKNYNVPTVVQIWEKKKHIRETYKKPIKSLFFNFTTKEEADFRIQRVGGNAGTADTNLDYSEESNYFIKNLSHLSNQDFIKIVNKSTFPTINDVVGPKSLSKRELVEVIENSLKQHNKRIGE